MVEAKVRVIYGDTDQMGVVYYANYFRYFELVRGEFFRARGRSYTEVEKEGLGLPVVDAGAQYRAPARYDDLLIIKATVAELRRASVRFEYEIRRESDGAVLTTGHTVHACVNQEGRPTAMPKSVLSLLGPSPDKGS